jgi:hypothetical protein
MPIEIMKWAIGRKLENESCISASLAAFVARSTPRRAKAAYAQSRAHQRPGVQTRSGKVANHGKGLPGAIAPDTR